MQIITLIVFLILGSPFIFGILVNLCNFRPVFHLTSEVERAIRFQQGLCIYFSSEMWSDAGPKVEWHRDSYPQATTKGIPTSIKPISFVPYFREEQNHPEAGLLVSAGFSSFLALLTLALPFGVIFYLASGR